MMRFLLVSEKSSRSTRAWSRTTPDDALLPASSIATTIHPESRQAVAFASEDASSTSWTMRLPNRTARS